MWHLLHRTTQKMVGTTWGIHGVFSCKVWDRKPHNNGKSWNRRGVITQRN
jgi:hypothetical protein